MFCDPGVCASSQRHFEGVCGVWVLLYTRYTGILGRLGGEYGLGWLLHPMSAAAVAVAVCASIMDSK